jgi:transcriptional regulator with XRE-family HTH domain
MVNVVWERLRAALDSRGLNPSQLAERTGDNQQTIDYIVRGKTRRTRKGRLRAVASELEVPWSWLSGDMKSLPFSGHYLPEEESTGENPDLPSSTQLALNHLWERFRERCGRDVHGESDSCSDSSEDGTPDAWVWIWDVVLHELTDPLFWRAKLLLSYYEPPDRLTPELAQATVALAKGMERVLEPWFEGRAALNLDAFYQVTDIPLPPGAEKAIHIPEHDVEAERLEETMGLLETAVGLLDWNVVRGKKGPQLRRVNARKGLISAAELIVSLRPERLPLDLQDDLDTLTQAGLILEDSKGWKGELKAIVRGMSDATVMQVRQSIRDLLDRLKEYCSNAGRA